MVKSRHRKKVVILKLEQFNFSNITVRGLSIFIDNKEVICGFVADVLKQISHLKNYEIKSTNYYFDTFVIRLKINK